jgi:hypothetical protein
MKAASAIILMLELYASIGLLVAALFLTVGIGRIDPSAAHAYAFRFLILPGAILLWPLVLSRWLKLARQQPNQNR